jgi:hypothetical protein
MKRVREYEPVLSQLMLWMARDTRFRCRPKLADVLSRHERLVFAISHGSPLSWLPSVSLLSAHVNARGGGHRRPVGIMDRVFFEMGLTRRIAQYLTQSERPLSFGELVQSFMTGRCDDLVVFPEGSNCFFGDPGVIQEFRSSKFVEVAIRAKAPILVCVHKGSEKWATALSVEKQFVDRLDWLPKFAWDFLEHRLRANGLFTLPLWPAPMDKFEMLCELYEPTLDESDLSEDPGLRHEQIRSEGEKIRALMMRMLAELNESIHTEATQEFQGELNEEWNSHLKTEYRLIQKPMKLIVRRVALRAVRKVVRKATRSKSPSADSVKNATH